MGWLFIGWLFMGVVVYGGGCLRLAFIVGEYDGRATPSADGPLRKTF